MKRDIINSSIKILPVHYPLMTTYTHHANLLSILSNYRQSFPWIFSNYIQLYLNKNLYKHSWGDFYFPFPYDLRPADFCKLIRYQKIDRELVEKKWDGIDFIIESVNSNQYVILMVNCFYMTPHDLYQKEHTMHDVFVYGYDLNKELLYVGDFFKFDKYSFETITFNDFYQAYSTLPQTHDYHSDYLKKMVHLYQFNENSVYQFNIQNVITGIKSYLLHDPVEYPDIYNRDEIVVGIEVYNALKDYIRAKAAHQEFDFDIRPFYLLYDHKTIMSLRINYLREQGYFNEYCNIEKIMNDLHQLETRSQIIMNMVIKFSFSRANALIDRIISRLTDLEKNEVEVWNTILLGLNHL